MLLFGHLGLGVLLDEGEYGTRTSLGATGARYVELVGSCLTADELESLEGLAVGEVGAEELLTVEDLDDDLLGIVGAIGDVYLIVGAAVEDDGELGAGLAGRSRELDVEVLDVLVVSHCAESLFHQLVTALCRSVGTC